MEHLVHANIVGMGHDIVDIPSFHEQLSLPGSRFERLFSVREIAQCRSLSDHASDDEYARHLAARWAGKEAFLKAWSHAIGQHDAEQSMPYSVDTFPWGSVEILEDNARRPSLKLSTDVRKKLKETLPEFRCAHVSLSHDGDTASAVVILESNKS